ncbi:hypothetical protein Taro_033720 [Colocasia esculenta]|uniref:Uncharacterized protein n=1 Tax=Colocasia esculenta TaxID=4460 RepID=A0A843W7T0_COLES|nr:hypothetical protein [Colocasia esculenta]
MVVWIVLIPRSVTGFRVQPSRRIRTCAKAKKTYGGLDKESLVQSGVFLVERRVALRPSRRTDTPRQAEPTFGVTRASVHDQSTSQVQIAMGPGVATPSEVAADRAVATPEGGPIPEKGFCPFFQLHSTRSGTGSLVEVTTAHYPGYEHRPNGPT